MRISRRISAGSHTSMRFTVLSSNRVIRNALSIPMKWPTGAPMIWGGPVPGYMRWSCRASNPMVRCEWTTPFGSRVVPEVKPTTAGASGSTSAGAANGSASSNVAKGCALFGSSLGGDSPATSHSGSTLLGEQCLVGREVVGVAETIRGHDDIGRRRRAGCSPPLSGRRSGRPGRRPLPDTWHPRR